MCVRVCAGCVSRLTHGLQRGVLVEADAQVVVRVRQRHGRTQGRQGRVVQMIVI